MITKIKMNYNLNFIYFAILAIISTGCSNSSNQYADSSHEKLVGQSVYEKYCIACHQKDGKGLGGTLAGDFVNDKSILAKSNDILFDAVWNGKKGKTSVMPAHKGMLQPSQVSNAINYIRKIYGNK